MRTVGWTREPELAMRINTRNCSGNGGDEEMMVAMLDMNPVAEEKMGFANKSRAEFRASLAAYGVGGVVVGVDVECE